MSPFSKNIFEMSHVYHELKNKAFRFLNVISDVLFFYDVTFVKRFLKQFRNRVLYCMMSGNRVGNCSLLLLLFICVEFIELLRLSLSNVSYYVLFTLVFTIIGGFTFFSISFVRFISLSLQMNYTLFIIFFFKMNI